MAGRYPRAILCALMLSLSSLSSCAVTALLADTSVPQTAVVLAARDASQILFVSKRDGNAEIYLLNADGTGQRALTDNTEHDYMADWSPFGKENERSDDHAA